MSMAFVTTQTDLLLQLPTSHMPNKLPKTANIHQESKTA